MATLRKMWNFWPEIFLHINFILRELPRCYSTTIYSLGRMRLNMLGRKQKSLYFTCSLSLRSKKFLSNFFKDPDNATEPLLYFGFLHYNVIRCNRFAIVEWLQALIITVTAEAVLLIRVHALIRKRYIDIFLASVMVSQCVVVFVAMGNPHLNGAYRLPDIDIEQFHICILYSDLKMDIAYLSLCILFDVIVFGLTVHLTFHATNKFDVFSVSPPGMSLLQTIQRDGLLYFTVILSGNLVWLLMVLFARPGIKFINAQPSMIFTSIMINRLTLSLRRVHHESMNWQRPSPTTCDFSIEMAPMNFAGSTMGRERECNNR